jgi:hypothetical protein
VDFSIRILRLQQRRDRRSGGRDRQALPASSQERDDVRRLTILVTVPMLAVVVYVAVGRWLGNPVNRALIWRYQYRGCVQQASQAAQGMSASDLEDLGYHLESSPSSFDLHGWQLTDADRSQPAGPPGGGYPPPSVTGQPRAPEQAATSVQLGPGEQIYLRYCLEPSTSDPQCGTKAAFMAVVDSAGDVRQLGTKTSGYCE